MDTFNGLTIALNSFLILNFLLLFGYFAMVPIAISITFIVLAAKNGKITHKSQRHKKQAELLMALSIIFFVFVGFYDVFFLALGYNAKPNVWSSFQK